MTISDAESLYEAGWRQGTVFEAQLPLSGLVLDASGALEHGITEHPLWIVASQDCDLDSVSIVDRAPTIELRPIYDHDPPKTWGIKSWTLRVDDARYLDSEMPHVHISPAALTTLGDGPRQVIDDGRLAALKTWLGLRYRRPAVPTHLEDLARAIARSIDRHKAAPVVAQLHDVLFQVDDSRETYRYSLFAVATDGADVDDVRGWLAAVVLDVPASLGLADEIEAYTKATASLHLIETSYSAQASDITWRRGSEPSGAT